MGRRADNVIRFIELACTKEDGSPLLLSPWQKDYIQACYPGEPASPRTITNAIQSTGRKNGKSSLGSALLITHTAGPEAIPGSSVRAVATTKRQAGFLFKHMVRMVEAKEELRTRMEIKASTMSMWCMETGVSYETMAARVGASHGDNVAFFLYDELGQAKDMDLYDSMEKAQSAVPGGGLAMVMSTNSMEPGNPLADLIEMVEKGQQAGEMRHWHKEVWAGDPEKDPYDWDNIRAANPNLGVSISRKVIEKDIEEAKLSPQRRAHFRAYRLNLTAGNHTSLVDPMVWAEAKHPTKSQEQLLKEMRGEEVQLGLDLSDVKDLTSLGLFFPDHGVCASDNWLPTETLDERSREDRMPYADWEKMGYLRTVPGKVIDHEVIYRRLAELTKLYRVRSLRYDRWRMKPILTALEQRHVSMETHDFGQGYKSMAPAIETFEAKLLSGQLVYGHNPILTMAMLNCKTKENPQSISNERKPWRSSRKQKIDSAVALIMAVADLGEPETPKSTWFFPQELLDSDDPVEFPD